MVEDGDIYPSKPNRPLSSDGEARGSSSPGERIRPTVGFLLGPRRVSARMVKGTAVTELVDDAMTRCRCDPHFSPGAASTKRSSS